jgi:hypothetical protein
MERILASPEFHATDRQLEFLQFVVAEAIAGRAQEIKAYTVATRVFGRKADFDQATDPIVSIQANSSSDLEGPTIKSSLGVEFNWTSIGRS